MAVDVEQITDHVGQAVGRFVEQYKNKPKFAALIGVAAGRTQVLEDAAWQLFPWVATGIDNASGVNLDLLGKLVGEPRGTSVNDSEYRIRIRARVRANFSSGTVEQVLAVFAGLMVAIDDTIDPTAGQLQLLEGPPAAFELLVVSLPMPPAQVLVWADFLRDAKAAGVYAVLRWNQRPLAQMFTTAIACFFAADTGPGATRIDVVGSTARFPDTGSLLLYPLMLFTSETVTYARKTASSFEGVSATASFHAQGEAIALANSAARGFSSATLGGGGHLAGARGV